GHASLPRLAEACGVSSDAAGGATSMGRSSRRMGTLQRLGGSFVIGSALLQASGSPLLVLTALELALLAPAPAPNRVAVVATEPSDPCCIANAPTNAPNTKCVAPSQLPFRSAFVTWFHVVRRAPTMRRARSSVEPAFTSPPSLARSVTPP